MDPKMHDAQAQAQARAAIDLGAIGEPRPEHTPDVELGIRHKRELEEAIAHVEDHDKQTEYHQREASRWRRICDSHRAALEQLRPDTEVAATADDVPF